MKKRTKHDEVDEAVSRLTAVLEGRPDHLTSRMSRDASQAERASLLARANPLSDITEAEVIEMMSNRPDTFERCDGDGTPDPRGEFWHLTLKHLESDGNA